MISLSNEQDEKLKNLEMVLDKYDNELRKLNFTQANYRYYTKKFSEFLDASLCEVSFVVQMSLSETTTSLIINKASTMYRSMFQKISELNIKDLDPEEIRQQVHTYMNESYVASEQSLKKRLANHSMIINNTQDSISMSSFLPRINQSLINQSYVDYVGQGKSIFGGAMLIENDESNKTFPRHQKHQIMLLNPSSPKSQNNNNNNNNNIQNAFVKKIKYSPHIKLYAHKCTDTQDDLTGMMGQFSKEKDLKEQELLLIHEEMSQQLSQMDEAIKCKRNSDNRHSTEASVRLKEMAIAMSKSHQDIEKYLMDVVVQQGLQDPLQNVDYSHIESLIKGSIYDVQVTTAERIMRMSRQRNLELKKLQKQQIGKNNTQTQEMDLPQLKQALLAKQQELDSKVQELRELKESYDGAVYEEPVITNTKGLKNKKSRILRKDQASQATFAQQIQLQSTSLTDGFSQREEQFKNEIDRLRKETRSLMPKNTEETLVMIIGTDLSSDDKIQSICELLQLTNKPFKGMTESLESIKAKIAQVISISKDQSDEEEPFQVRVASPPKVKVQSKVVDLKKGKKKQTKVIIKVKQPEKPIQPLVINQDTVHQDIVHQGNTQQDTVHYDNTQQSIVHQNNVHQDIVHQANTQQSIVHQKNVIQDNVHQNNVIQGNVNQGNVNQGNVNQQNVTFRNVPQDNIQQNIQQEKLQRENLNQNHNTNVQQNIYENGSHKQDYSTKNSQGKQVVIATKLEKQQDQIYAVNESPHKAQNQNLPQGQMQDQQQEQQKHVLKKQPTLTLKNTEKIQDFRALLMSQNSVSNQLTQEDFPTISSPQNNTRNLIPTGEQYNIVQSFYEDNEQENVEMSQEVSKFGFNNSRIISGEDYNTQNSDVEQHQIKKSHLAISVNSPRNQNKQPMFHRFTQTPQSLITSLIMKYVSTMNLSVEQQQNLQSELNIAEVRQAKAVDQSELQQEVELQQQMEYETSTHDYIGIIGKSMEEKIVVNNNNNNITENNDSMDQPIASIKETKNNNKINNKNNNKNNINNNKIINPSSDNKDNDYLYEFKSQTQATETDIYITYDIIDLNSDKNLSAEGNIKKLWERINKQQHHDQVQELLLKIKNLYKKKQQENITYYEFKKFYSKILGQHKSCGDSCIHLQRFFRLVGFQTLHDYRRKEIKPTKQNIQPFQNDLKK